MTPAQAAALECAMWKLGLLNFLAGFAVGALLCGLAWYTSSIEGRAKRAERALRDRDVIGEPH